MGPEEESADADTQKGAVVGKAKRWRMQRISRLVAGFNKHCTDRHTDICTYIHTASPVMSSWSGHMEMSPRSEGSSWLQGNSGCSHNTIRKASAYSQGALQENLKIPFLMGSMHVYIKVCYGHTITQTTVQRLSMHVFASSARSIVSPIWGGERRQGEC